jgi:hypothetical protein
MAFALWIDASQGLAWAQGTHEYRPMGVAVLSATDQFRVSDFDATRRIPRELRRQFAGFYGSLEEVNIGLKQPLRLRATPAHLL